MGLNKNYKTKYEKWGKRFLYPSVQMYACKDVWRLKLESWYCCNTNKCNWWNKKGPSGDIMSKEIELRLEQGWTQMCQGVGTQARWCVAEWVQPRWLSGGAYGSWVGPIMELGLHDLGRRRWQIVVRLIGV